MINTEFMNGSIGTDIEDIVREYASFNESCKKEINNMFAEFELLEEKVALESAIMDTVPDQMMMVYESEKKNIFEKIGKFILDIFNNFIKAIDGFIDKIKLNMFKSKSEFQKLDILLKKHPELKDEEITKVQKAFLDGSLNLNDMKGLKELDSTFDELVKMVKNKDVDPKSIKGKIEKAKKEFEKDKDKWAIAKVAGVLTAVYTIKKFGPDMKKLIDDNQAAKKKAKAEYAEIYEELQKNNSVDHDMGKWQLLLEFWRFKNQKYVEVSEGLYRGMDKVYKAVATFLDKHTSKEKSELFKDNLTAISTKKAESEKEASEKRIEQIRAEQEVKKAAQPTK